MAGAKEAVSGVHSGQWPLVLGGEEVGAQEMGQSGQAVARGFPVSARGGAGLWVGWRVEVPEQGSNR